MSHHDMPSSVLSGLRRQPHIRDLTPFTAKGRRRIRKLLGVAQNAVIHKRDQIDTAKTAAAIKGYTKPKPRKTVSVPRTSRAPRRAWKSGNK